MIMDVVDNKEWEGMRAGRKGPKVSHLMFVDDLPIFRKGTVQQITISLRRSYEEMIISTRYEPLLAIIVVPKNNEAGYGGLARNNDGIWLGGFSKRVGKCNVITAELWCIQRFKGKKIQLRDMNLIRRIKIIMATFLKVKVVKIHWEANKSVYTLASIV
ncbi:hypothetical protein KIW84_061342 [Lathyrus oleraceus]|uniref:Uncharacterized protein n=1 Tax=Pisum sativum TaxID=3888 RepID=A0A9D5A6P0_PEA|nr:hypothetical protein KIW84_061342 [Pisum sativum]